MSLIVPNNGDNMKKPMSILKPILASAVVLPLLLLAGCSSDAGDSGAADSSGGDEKGLVLYSGDPTSADYVEMFNEKYPDINVEVISGNTGELLSRVNAEAAKPLGDVLWSSGDPALSTPDLYTKLPASITDRTLPEYKLESGYGVSLTGMLNTIFYSPDLVKKGDGPTSWADLADPKWKGKIYIANPASSGSAFSVIADWVTVGGWELVEKIAPNLVVVEGSAAPFQAVVNGQAEIAVMNESFLTFAEDPNVVTVNPKEGASMTTMTMFQIAGGPNPKNAELFIDWMLSDETQAYIAENRAGGRPVVAGDFALTDIAPLDEVKVIKQDPDALAQKDEWIDRWKDIITSV